jgi:hypothetical protein
LFENLLPINMVFVVDVSGSMASSADVAGGAEDTGMTLLDVAGHAVRACVRSLRVGVDHVSIVAYSSEARVVLPLSTVTETVIGRVDERVNALSPEGCTNIFGGMSKALSECGNNIDITGSRDVIVLLTDGVSNVEPPRGTVPMVRKYVDQRKREIGGEIARNTTIMTVGLGKTQDEAQLSAIADIGDAGRYTFVCDPGMLCTCFANIMAFTMCYRDTVTITEEKHGGDLEVCVGQDRTVLLLRDDDNHNLVNMLIDLLTTNEFGLDVDASLVIVKRVAGTLNSGGDARVNLKEIQTAVSRRGWYVSWGKRYIMSLLACLQAETGYNARDVCCNEYGGDTYHEIVETVTTAFESIPPPVPSGRSSMSYGGGRGGSSSPRTVNMSAYNNMDGGCISGNTTIVTMRGETVLAENIRPGMVFEGLYNDGSRGPVTIQQVLRCPGTRTINVSSPAEVWLTPWHPYRDIWCDPWKFPQSLLTDDEEKVEHDNDDEPPPLVMDTDNVYNFVLLEVNARALVMGTVADRIDVAVLGHGVCVKTVDDEVLSHEYFGSRSRVVADVELLDVENERRVVNGFERDTTTHEVVGMI